FLHRSEVLSKVGQGGVDRLQGKQLRIKVRSRPRTKLLVLAMPPVPQRFKDAFIVAIAATILGRAGARSIQATWNNHILCQRLDLLYSNHMSPAIPKIVFVDKAGPFLRGDLAESDVSITLHFGFILGIWLSIVGVADDE